MQRPGTSCRASRLYTWEQPGQTASRRLPQATCSTPPVLDGKFIGTYRRDEAERGRWNTEGSSRRTTQSAEKSRSVRADRDKKVLQLP
jgi:hypothetical protein